MNASSDLRRALALAAALAWSVPAAAQDADPGAGPVPLVPPADVLAPAGEAPPGAAQDADPGADPVPLVPPADVLAPAGEAPPGAAQDADPGAGPVPLVPPAEALAPAGEVPPGAAAEGEAPPAFRIPDSPVTVDDLPDARPSWIGVLSEEEGGLGRGMWDGTDATLARRLLESVPVPPTPATRDLVRRLVLSRAAVPAPRERAGLSALGPDGAPVQPDDGEGGTFLGLRVETLVRIADAEGVARLAAAVPEGLRDGGFALRTLTARLAAGDAAGVCGEIPGLLGDGGGDALDLRKLLAVCQIVQGETDPAQLTLQLLEAELPGDDPFLAAAFAAAEGSPVLAPAGAGDRLARALVVAGGGGSVADGTDLSELRMIAQGRARPALRIGAAERAAAAGALPPAALARLYAEAELDESRYRGVGDVTRAFPPPEARAYLFQAASAATTAVDRARFLRLLWDSGADDPGLPALARATEALALSIEARPDLGWFSAAAARALLVAGRHEEAEAWIDLLAASPDLDFASSGDLYALLPALALAGRPIPEPYSVFPADDVRAALPRTGSGEEHVRELSRLLVTLEAVGIPVPEGSWVGLLDDGALRTDEEIPSAAVRYQLRDAVAAGRVAETVLFVLVILGPEGPPAAGPLALNAAIRSLRAVGLEADARALALEAAI